MTAEFNPFTTLLFDLDGTLVDSAPDIAAAVNKVLVEIDRAPLTEAMIRDFVGDGLGVTLERSLIAAGANNQASDLLDRLETIYVAGIAERTQPYRDVAATLALFSKAGLRMAVCTNKLTEPSNVILQRLGLAAYFELVVGPDIVIEKKPDPRHVQYCLDRLGVTAGETIMIGDSANDVLAAQGAGCEAIFVTYGYGIIGGEVAATVDRFADLPDALAGIAESRSSESLGLTPLKKGPTLKILYAGKGDAGPAEG